eukprot:768816-Hanusia_phi.AAC.1
MHQPVQPGRMQQSGGLQQGQQAGLGVGKVAPGQQINQQGTSQGHVPYAQSTPGSVQYQGVQTPPMQKATGHPGASQTYTSQSERVCDEVVCSEVVVQGRRPVKEWVRHRQI